MDVSSWPWAGIVLGSVSLLGGYVCRKVLIPNLCQVPLFSDFSSLKDYLKSSPEQKADVLVEGRVGRPDFVQFDDPYPYSEKTGLEGVVRQDTFIQYVVERDGKLRETSNLEGIKFDEFSNPFSLWDSHGCSIRVNSIDRAEGLGQVLQMVYEAKPHTVTEHYRILRKEYLLLLGTPLAGYGQAVLEYAEKDSTVVFTPFKVGTSIQKLEYPNKMKVSALNFVSFLLIVVGGGVVVFSGISLLVRFLQQRRSHKSKNATINPTKL